jgi:hypothetical protein
MIRETFAVLAAWDFSSSKKEKPAVCALPSITPIGMAALQPGASSSFSVIEQAGALGAKIDDAFLPDLTARKKFAASRVPRLADIALDELLSLQPSPACQEDRGRSAHHCAIPGDRQCRREGIHVPGAAGDGYGHRQFGPGHSQACCAVASTEQAACFCAVATRVSKASSSSAPSFCQRGTKVFVRPILLGLPLAISPRSCAPSEDWVLVTPRSESLGGRGCAMLPLPRSLCSRRSPLSPISASNCPARRSARSRMSVAE